MTQPNFSTNNDTLSEDQINEKYTIKNVLEYAVAKDASDIFINVDAPPYLRIAGELVPFEHQGAIASPLTHEAAESLIFGLCEEQHQQLLQIENKTEIDFSVPGGHGWVRVNIARQRGTWMCVIRLIPTEIRAFEKLGLPTDILEHLCRYKRGLILVTGPTGSGKSTTLASMIDFINKNYAKHIVTIEDPIEFHHHNHQSVINQREVGRDTPNFDVALKSALRQSPDVILVGEMRDPKTVSAAITAAETGHLVMGTLHTNGAKDTISRIIDAYPPEQQNQVRAQLANSLMAVVSQQLIKTVDNKGRAVAYEIMVLDNAMRAQIRDSKIELMENSMLTAKEKGNITMDETIIRLLQEGKISQERAMEHAIKPEEFKNKLKTSTTPQPTQNSPFGKRL